ncbi:hypothetical protein BCR32DRAFT_276229 [Anaeromyces robustus]|uniref:Uncharacterized protein n=1 Tax=Anaeromyces robustus TaxID=1754192 RepID=A0A1Y1XIH6_9FUNG|nr:hypothetical protein BCR32DRAFT_276229 [Anaeromyces robustus]|eukprot:ORX85559.1 hypothetical protein BCR32DRAFT_276229 [Anaeromyces robustus]
MFRMSRNIYCLHRIKSLKYHQIKKSHLPYEPNQFIILVASYNKLCKSIHKKCNEFRRQNCLFWIKVEIIKNNLVYSTKDPISDPSGIG